MQDGQHTTGDTGFHGSAFSSDTGFHGNAVAEPTDPGELVRRYQDGDKDALDELFRRYYDRVHRIVRVRMSSQLRGRCEADDIVNSAMGQAFRIFHRFEYREPSSVLNWLSKIALNKIRDRAKKIRRRPEVELEGLRPAGDSDATFDPKESGMLIPDELADAELRSKVDECLTELEEDHREVILHRDYGGHSWEAVGAELGRSAAAARMLHARAKLSLMKQLKKRKLI